VTSTGLEEEEGQLASKKRKTCVLRPDPVTETQKKAEPNPLTNDIRQNAALILGGAGMFYFKYCNFSVSIILFYFKIHLKRLT